MENRPPVSIYIITYLTSAERCDVLKRTCEVALMQNYPNFEIVVSDNGGEFFATEALKSMDDPRVKIFRSEDNTGFSGNMNRCLKLCQYDVIKPICDDDLIHPDFLNHTVPWVDDDTYVVVDVSKFPFGKEPPALFKPITTEPVVEHRAPGYRKDVWNLPYEPYPSAVLYTRNFYRDIGGCDSQTITADWDLCVEACLYRNIAYLKLPLCFVGEWAGSLTIAMQQAKPFFYPTSGLYTKFRLLKCKGLALSERAGIFEMLVKELFWQSLRPLRHPLSKNHREGYADFMKRFRQLTRWSKDDFTARPNPPQTSLS